MRAPGADSASTSGESGRWRMGGDTLYFTPDGREARPPVWFRYTVAGDLLTLVDPVGNAWHYRRPQALRRLTREMTHTSLTLTCRIVLAPLLALGAAACVQREPPGEPGQERPPVRITMERGPCFGACPTYRVTIDGDGLVRFQPLGRMQGSPDSARLAPETALRLVERFERDGFFALADRYEHGTPGCDRFRTDQPSAVLRVERGGGVKEVRHSHGCDDAPPVLSALEAAVDSAAGVARWTGDVTPR